MTDGGRDYLDITFQNSGATPATMSGQVRVAGAHPTTDPVRTTVPPLTHTKVRVPFVMPSGDAHRAGVGVDEGRERKRSDVGRRHRFRGCGRVGVGAAHAGDRAPRVVRRRSAKGSSFPSPVLIVVALLFLAAAVWFALEFKRSRGAVGGACRGRRPGRRGCCAGRRGRAGRSRRRGRARRTPGSWARSPSQLARARRVDRSSGRAARRRGRPGRGRARYAATGARADGRARTPRTAPANPAPMFFAPAAQRGPEAEFDPYDWPTQQQLDDFAARRSAAQSDT